MEGHFNKPYLQQESTFWRRSLWDEAGGRLSESVSLAGDLELWLRFFRHTVLYTVDTLLGGYRYHGAQRGIEQADTYLQEALQLIETERSVHCRGEGTFSPPPPVINLLREDLAAFVADTGIYHELPSYRSCWRHYTENLIGITNVLAREKQVERVPFFENEVMLFGLVKPSAMSLMADRLDELSSVRQKILQLIRVGENHVHLGNDEQALAAFEEAYALSPSFSQTSVQLMCALWRRGEHERVFEHLTRLLAGHPHERSVVLAVVEILMGSKARELARSVCDEYLVTNPHDAEILGWRSKIGGNDV